MRISDWSSDVCSSDLVSRIGPGYEQDLPAWESVPKALPDIVAGMRQEPAKTLWREGGYGLLVYESEEQVRALDPDFRMLRDMGNILIIATAPGDKTDIVSRVLAHIGRESWREKVWEYG